MEPINQKERTTAFIQFMVMFVIAIVLVLCLALFGVKLCHDDYADLKAKLNDCQKKDAALPKSLSSEVDSIRKKILDINANNEIEFEEIKNGYMDNLETEWRINTNQVDENEELAVKKNVLKVFKDWLNSKKTIISVGDQSSDVRTLNNTIKDLREEKRDLDAKLSECQKAKQ